MAQFAIELILMRHLASRLVVPVFVVDRDGDMVYFNGPAERVLGRRFDEIRRMPFAEWTVAFVPATGEGPLTADELPLVIALRSRAPAHSSFVITAGDGVHRAIEVTAFPILGDREEALGAVAMFWETPAG